MTLISSLIFFSPFHTENAGATKPASTASAKPHKGTTTTTTEANLKPSKKVPTVITVAFSGEGEWSPTSKQVKVKGRYGDLPIPQRADHVFAGWYTDKVGGSRVSAYTKVQSTIQNNDLSTGFTTLYAHWVRRSEIGNEQHGIPVLMYHWFYDPTTGETKSDDNWMEIQTFEEQMKYLHDNKYYFPTWEELNAYIDGTIVLPEKSVMITDDDGKDCFFTLGVPVLKKYDIPATGFIITSKIKRSKLEKYSSDILQFQSHTNDMHIRQEGGKGMILFSSQSAIEDDLRTSAKILKTGYVFAYPFGHYNATAESALQSAGFKLAFTTRFSRVRPGANKLELPRVRMSAGESLSTFAASVR